MLRTLPAFQVLVWCGLPALASACADDQGAFFTSPPSGAASFAGTASATAGSLGGTSQTLSGGRTGRGGASAGEANQGGSEADSGRGGAGNAGGKGSGTAGKATAASGGKAAGGNRSSGGAGTAGASDTGDSGAGGGSGGGDEGEGGSPGDGDEDPLNLQSGSLPVSGFTSAPHCTRIVFPEPFAVPAAELFIFTSIVHPGSTTDHDGMAIWVEGVTSQSFVACVTEDADSDNAHAGFRIDWVAAEGAAAASLGARFGRVSIASGVTQVCRSVTFETPFSEPPHVQASLRHAGARASWDDGGTTWFEEVSATGFRLCAQELESADQVLDQTSIDWAAYPAEVSSRGFVAGEVAFPAATGVTCQDVETGCVDCRNVQLTSNHRRRTETSATAVHQSTLVWAEDLGSSGLLRICVIESSENDLTRDAHLSVDWLLRRSND